MPAGIANPVERAAVAADEHRRRDQARAKYLASPVPRSPSAGSRRWPHAARRSRPVPGVHRNRPRRPELVYGVFRVPDRISPLTPDRRRARLESAVVHRAPAGAATRLPQWSAFDADTNRWSREPTASHRCSTRTMAIAALTATGPAPQHCLAHQPRYPNGEDQRLGRRIGRRRSGVRAGYGCAGADAARDASATNAVDVALGGQPGVHVEVMNWSAVAQAVHPRPQRGPEIPSPFPYLPATPDELPRRVSADRGDRAGRLLRSLTTIDESSPWAAHDERDSRTGQP